MLEFPLRRGSRTYWPSAGWWLVKTRLWLRNLALGCFQAAQKPPARLHDCHWNAYSIIDFLEIIIIMWVSRTAPVYDVRHLTSHVPSADIITAHNCISQIGQIKEISRTSPAFFYFRPFFRNQFLQVIKVWTSRIAKYFIRT